MHAAGSLDRTVKLWDLSSGLPLCSSKPHKGTVRCLAMDADCLVSGGSDPTLRLWLAQRGAAPPPAKRSGGSSRAGRLSTLAAAGGDGDDDDDETEERGDDGEEEDGGGVRRQQGSAGLARRPRFDVSARPDFLLKGHTGPVTSMCLTESALFSGGWDYTVRVWRRRQREAVSGAEDMGVVAAEAEAWPCACVLTFDDWVTGAVARGHQLMVAAGRHVSVLDVHTGQVVRRFEDLVSEPPGLGARPPPAQVQVLCAPLAPSAACALQLLRWR